MILCDDLQFIYHKMTYPFIWKNRAKSLFQSLLPCHYHRRYVFADTYDVAILLI